SGLFILEASGTGDLFASGYGIISEETVKGSMTVDTGHLVAWEPSLTYRIKRVGSWKSTLLSGEGLVVEFSGMGKILICSRNVSSLVSWISPWLPA
ncbi:TPA: TIGR00266 family protein, partial [bacterium]|nr:TIGR00266 family protein [bacterium]